MPPLCRNARLLLLIFAAGAAPFAQPADPPIATGASATTPSAGTAAAPANAPATPVLSDAEKRRQKANEELHRQEHQRILGVMPDFNVSNVRDAEPLTPAQTFQLAARSALDPFTFVAAGFDAGLSQWQNDFPGYGQGASGYAKRFGASYADSFDGTMIGNALFPVLLKEDPRYFRKGTGSFGSRFAHAMLSTVECRYDNGKWGPNFANVLGNFAAGGISNLYYPASDRGAVLTTERALTVSAEGAIGAVFVEFWPDISRKIFPKHQGKDLP